MHLRERKLTAAEPQGRVRESANVGMQVDEVIAYEDENAGVEELQGRAMQLQKEAVAYFKEAAELSKHGRQRASMKYEMKGLELESKANDLISKAEQRIHEAWDHEMRSMDFPEAEEVQGPDGVAVDSPPEVEPLRQEAQMLLEQAQAYTVSATQSRERRDEREALEYEQMALELESQANDALHRAEQILQDARSEEMRKHGMEVGDEAS